MIDSSLLLQGLEIFIVGWGGIFIVMGVLYATIKGLLKFFPPKKEETSED